MNVLRVLVAICGYFLTTSTAWASAWNLDPLNSQIIITSAKTNTDKFLDESGKKIAIGIFEKTESRIYTELGLTQSIMFVGQAAYQNIEFIGSGSNVSFKGFDETKIGLQYQVKREDGLAASLQTAYIFDGGLDDPRLNLGGVNNELEIRALYGRSRKLDPKKHQQWVWFYDLQAAGRYDLKLDTISRWQIDLTMGVKPNEKWMGLAQLYVSRTESMTTKGTGQALFSIPPTKQLKSEVSIAYLLRPNRYAQIGVTQTLAGQNVVQERGVFFSFWQSF